MPMTRDVSLYIQANISEWVSPSNGTNPAGNIFETFLPDTPDRALAVYQMAGGKPQRSLGKGYAWETPKLRIVNRATTSDWATAQADARTVWDLLRVVNNQALNGTQYIIIDAVGNPQPQELDANNRPLYVQEFSVMKYMSD